MVCYSIQNLAHFVPPHKVANECFNCKRQLLFTSWSTLTMFGICPPLFHRQKYDRADLLRRVQSKCKFRLEAQRREYTREGRSWRHVADAMKR
jgi:hypothetical protein